jgi:DNA-binding PadR family transcriptional regulator
MNDLILLAMLLEGPQHGYALKKKVGLVTGHGEMHNNLVYPLLKRFVQQGWVHRRSADGQRGQTRELYALTTKGKQELVRNLSDFGEKAAAFREAFRFRVSLFPLLDPAMQATILDRREEWLTKRHENLLRIEEATGPRGWSAEVVDFTKAEILAERKWIARLRKRMQTRTVAKRKG